MSKNYKVYYTSVLCPGEKFFNLSQSTSDKAVGQFHALMQLVNGLGEADYKMVRMTEILNKGQKEEIENEIPAAVLIMTNPAVGQTKIQPAPVREVK